MSPILPATAFTTSPDGGSGNITSQSSDTLPSDSMVSYGMVGLDDFYGGSTWQHEMQILTGVYMGLTDRSEAGIELSLASNSSTIASGSSLRYFRAHGKYRFYGSRAKGQAASVYIYSTTGEVPDKPSLTSGKTSNGLQLTYSTYGAQSDVHYAMSMDTRDYKVYSGGVFSYELLPVLSLSASRMFYTNTDRIYELGVKAESATVNSSSNGNLYLVAGAHFNTQQALQYTAGVMLDIPGSVGALQARYFIGFTYTSEYSNRKRATPPSKPVTPAKAMGSVSQAVSTAPAKPKVMVPEVKSSAISTKPCLARVEVMDMSGITGLGEKVAEKLRDNGYCVPSVYSETNAMSFYSQLYYSTGNEDTAKELSRQFEIKGQVDQRALPADVEIRFIVGRDQQ
jgi:hypothetical protein